MEQTKTRASPEKEGKAKEPVTQTGEAVLRAHDLIFTPDAIIPKYTIQWR